MKEKLIKIKTEDQKELELNLFEPEMVNQGVILIHPATAVLKRIYRKFATQFADWGYTVMVYNYRGVEGLDRVEHRNAKMQDWALYDLKAAQDYAAELARGTKLVVIGHSFGGQALGVIPNHQAVSAYVFIGAGIGYWKNFPKQEWPKLWTLWYGLVPAITRVADFFPAHALGLGEDLPSGVAMQWRNWCCHPNYLYSELGSTFHDHTHALRAPSRAYLIQDDKIGSEKAVSQLLTRYTNLNPEIVKVAPKDFGANEIGHFGFFRSAFQNTLWKGLRDYVESIS